MSHAITQDMTIGELVQKYPSVAEVLQEEGVHCVGCGASYYETIGEGLAGHGRTEEEIQVVVEKLNKAIPSESGNEDLIITENAAAKLKEVLQKSNKNGAGLKVTVIKGGCAGKEYGYKDIYKTAFAKYQICDVAFVCTRVKKRDRSARVRVRTCVSK